MGALESGKDFLASVLAKLPAEQRAQAQAIFDAAEAKDAVTLLGDGALARADYSKQMDDLIKGRTALEADQQKAKDLYESNKRWYETNSAALAEIPELRKKAAAGGRADDEPPPPELDPRKVAQEVIAEQGVHYVQIASWLSAKAVEHYKRFGEELDTMALTGDPRLGQPVSGQPGRVVSLPDLYLEKFGTRIKEQEAAEEKKRIDGLVAAQLKEERTKQTQDQPFPLRGGAEPSVLDTLATAEGAKAFTVDRAAQHYTELQAGRGA